MRELSLLKAIGEADDVFVEDAYIESARVSRFPTRAVIAAAATLVAATSAVIALNSGTSAVKPDISAEISEETKATETSAISGAPETTWIETGRYTYGLVIDTPEPAPYPPDAATSTEPIAAVGAMTSTAMTGDGAVTTVALPAETAVTTPSPALTDDSAVITAENPATGMMSGYEGLADIIAAYSDKVNFVRYEIVKRYTIEEIEELNKGFVPPIETDATSLYLAHIEYDYLNEEPVNKDVYLARAGTENSRAEYMPILSEGQKYAGFFMDLRFDSHNACIPELDFMYREEGGEPYLYQQRFEDIKLYSNGKPLGEDVPPDRQLYTPYDSADGNPFMLVRKYREEELAEFFRVDFCSRGYEIKGLSDSVFGTTSKNYEYNEDWDVIPTS